VPRGNDAHFEPGDNGGASDTHAPDPFRSVTEPSSEPAFAPQPSEPERGPEPTDQPKRRSTVREAARFLWGQSEESASESSEAPAPEPRSDDPVAEPAEIAPDRPRRSGWWSRR
jgi:hypothetical protein